MSFLSNFGYNFTAPAIIIGEGYNATSGGLTPQIIISNAGASTNNTVIAANSTGTLLTGTFYNSSGSSSNAIFRSYRSIRGYGQAIIGSTYNVAANNLDFRQTISIDNVGWGFPSGLVTWNCSIYGSDSALTSFTNLSILMSSSSNTFIIDGYSGLANITCKNLAIAGNTSGHDIRITGAALTAQSIENLLVALNNGCTGSTTFGTTLNFTGGTSSGASALTAAASAARTALIAKGFTVALNP